jgi:hypothetical protein
MRRRTRISWKDITAPRKRLKLHASTLREDRWPKLPWNLQGYEEGHGYAGERIEKPIQTFRCLIREGKK